MASITKRKCKYSVVYDYYDEEGVRHQKWETWGTYAEAKRRKAEIEHKQTNNTFVKPSIKRRFLNVTKIIAFANQKGGVAKTTSAIALAQILSMDGKKVLFLDLDPQENASNTLSLNPDIPSLYDFMDAGEKDYALLSQCFQQVKDCPNITAIHGSIRLSAADMRYTMQGREYILYERLKTYLDNYDVVIIDTPPSLGLLTVNALTCADTVVVPVSPDGYSLQGFHQLTESIRTIKRYSNPRLQTGGILITRYVPNTNVSKAIREIASEYAEMANTKVYKAVIRQTVSVNESISVQQGLMLFAPKSTAAQDYRAFASEIKRDELSKGGEMNGKAETGLSAKHSRNVPDLER